jgi:hypothetical protein
MKVLKKIIDWNQNLSIKNKVKYVLLAVSIMISLIFAGVNYFLTGS